MSYNPPTPPQTPVASPVMRPSSPPVLAESRLFISPQLFSIAIVTVVLLLLAHVLGDNHIVVYIAICIACFFSGAAAFSVFKWFKARKDADTSFVCIAEVEIDSDVVITVKSWWSPTMSMDSVRRNGERVALQNARQWVEDNRSKGGEFELALTKVDADRILNQYLCNDETDDCCAQCAVCLEDFDSDSKLLTLNDCNHTFHHSCLSFWFCKSSKLQCPLCRKDHLTSVPLDQLPTRPKNVPRFQILSLQVERAPLTD